LGELREISPDLDVAYLHGASVDGLARTIGQAAAKLDATQAGYAVGGIYTGLLPRRFRAAHGAYYTPPALCERLLDLAEAAGVDWSSARVLDPACGGGAFLAPVARRMVEALGCRLPAAVLSDIQGRLAGFELDPFAAWMSQVFLDATLVELCDGPDIRSEPVVQVCDSLARHEPQDRFDLVIGNPPYGRVKLSPELRAAYQRSPMVSPAALVALLNSKAVDQVFRCINGSVAVSAYELQALPLPPPEDMQEMERLVRSQAGREALEREAEHLYTQRNIE